MRAPIESKGGNNGWRLQLLGAPTYLRVVDVEREVVDAEDML